MCRPRSTTGMTIAAILAALLPLAVPSGIAAPALFQLPAPAGPNPIGTTAWRVIDRSRRETFTGSTEFRNVEVLAWYPAAGPRRGDPAPYLREGLPEVRTFASLLRSHIRFFGFQIGCVVALHAQKTARVSAIEFQDAIRDSL